MMALENASGKDDDFDDEGLPLLPRHTKVGVPTRCDTPLKKKEQKRVVSWSNPLAHSTVPPPRPCVSSPVELPCTRVRSGFESNVSQPHA